MKEIKFRKKIKWVANIPDYGFDVEVTQHSFASEAFDINFSLKYIFCSYLIFSPTLNQEYLYSRMENYINEYRNCLEHLSWHGGVTYNELVPFYHNDILIHNIKIGDDFGHSWDIGNETTLEMVQKHILRIAEEAYNYLKDKI